MTVEFYKLKKLPMLKVLFVTRNLLEEWNLLLVEDLWVTEANTKRFTIVLCWVYFTIWKQILKIGRKRSFIFISIYVLVKLFNSPSMENNALYALRLFKSVPLKMFHYYSILLLLTNYHYWLTI